MEDGGEGDLSHEKVRVCERVCMRERKRKKERKKEIVRITKKTE